MMLFYTTFCDGFTPHPIPMMIRLTKYFDKDNLKEVEFHYQNTKLPPFDIKQFVDCINFLVIVV